MVRGSSQLGSTLSTWLFSYSRRVPLQNAYSRSSRSSWMCVVRACFLTCLSSASSSDATESRWLLLRGVVGVRGASHNKGVRSYWYTVSPPPSTIHCIMHTCLYALYMYEHQNRLTMANLVVWGFPIDEYRYRFTMENPIKVFCLVFCLVSPKIGTKTLLS